MAYDDVIVQLGEFGRYQKRIYVLLCLPAISCALHKLSGVFLQAKPQFRCRLPDEPTNASFWMPPDEMRQYFPPVTSGSDLVSNCSRYVLEGSVLTDNNTVSCTSWIYDDSVYKNSVLTEWNMVCDNAWLKATSDALLMTGVMLGSMIFGDLSDRLGRKPIFFISLVLQVVFGILVGLAPDVYTYMIARLIVGATTSGVFLVAYVIALEMVGPSWRMFAGVACQLFFTAGFLLVPAFAYFFKDWRDFQIALTLPGALFFCYWWFVPESVRWLLSKGRYEEAKQLLLKAAKENGTTISDELLNELCSQSEADKKTEESVTGSKPSVLDLFRFSNLRKKTMIIFFLWFVNSGTYYGLSWNTSNLGGNDYLNFMISGAVEVPAYVFLILTLDRWGRKLILCGSMIAAGVCLMATMFVPGGLLWLNIALAMAGKLAITASYGAVYVFSAEQFPTVIRNVGIGASSTFARFGGIAAPYINILSEFWTPLPLLVFGILALLGGLLALLLPETLNKTLPESIADCELFGKKVKVVQDDKEIQMNGEAKEKDKMLES